mgnify:CR=1 FL=1
MAKTQPRGIRNHNPGNIRHGDKWQGAAKIKNERDRDPDFVQFESPAWGIRALARVLIAYQDKHDLRTVRGIIGRWAPPNENNTGAYVNAVAARLGVEPDAEIDVYEYATMRPLVEAIIRHENGQQPYSAAEIDEGLKRAGVVRKGPMSRDPQTLATGAAAAGSATVAGTVAYSEIASVSSDLRAQGRESGDAKLVLAGSVVSLLAIGALAFIVFKKWKARR